jgi:hypothetical protein
LPRPQVRDWSCTRIRAAGRGRYVVQRRGVDDRYSPGCGLARPGDTRRSVDLVRRLQHLRRRRQRHAETTTGDYSLAIAYGDGARAEAFGIGGSASAYGTGAFAGSLMLRWALGECCG